MCDLNLRLTVNDNYRPFSESHDETTIGSEISGTDRCVDDTLRQSWAAAGGIGKSRPLA